MVRRKRHFSPSAEKPKRKNILRPIGCGVSVSQGRPSETCVVCRSKENVGLVPTSNLNRDRYFKELLLEVFRNEPHYGYFHFFKHFTHEAAIDWIKKKIPLPVLIFSPFSSDIFSVNTEIMENGRLAISSEEINRIASLLAEKYVDVYPEEKINIGKMTFAGENVPVCNICIRKWNEKREDGK